jgi:hypothetical protein
MQRKILIISPDSNSAVQGVQDLLDQGYQIEKMEPTHIHSTSSYSNTVHGKLAIYLTKTN